MRLTRAQVARYMAAQLPEHREEAVGLAAKWLVASGRQRQAQYLADDVAELMARSGYVLARLTVARPLSAAARTAVEGFLRAQTGATELELVVTIDPSILGGIRLETPTAQLDATVRSKLARLVEGASR